MLWIGPLGAQEPVGSIRGRIVDNSTQQPLAGVHITFGTRGAVTQSDGGYVLTGLKVGPDALQARLIGYAPVTQAITVAAGQTEIVDFTMTAQAVNLAAIVVTGYGEQRAGNITGAVTQLSSEEFNPGRVVSPQQLIMSKVAGVQVVDNNEPGGGVGVRIRGATSINASSDPLYVVDGLPIGNGGGVSAGRDPLNFLNPNDIESITVLKGGEAASIYGANAANGVVMITTKRGQGPPKVEYSVSFSTSSATRFPSMLNAAQFATAVNTYRVTCGALPEGLR
jgi:iron complex outermembrane receptor protein